MTISVQTRKEKAMTLVEVIVALCILTLLVAGVLLSFGYGFRTIKSVRHNQRATQILLEKLETIRLYSWTQINTPGFVPSGFMDVYDPQSAANPGITYTGIVQLLPFPRATSYSANLKQVVLTLNWSEDGKSHQRVVRTYVGRDGLQNYVY